jgi:hypothetical protein
MTEHRTSNIELRMKIGGVLFVFLGACLKMLERGCVVPDQPRQASNSRRVEPFTPCCGWSSTQSRSFFRQALKKSPVT